MAKGWEGNKRSKRTRTESEERQVCIDALYGVSVFFKASVIIKPLILQSFSKMTMFLSIYELNGEPTW